MGDFSICLEKSGNSKSLAELEEACPHLYENSDDESDHDEESDY